MDRTGYPTRVGVFDFEDDMPDVITMIEAKDFKSLLRNERIAPHIHWMREYREIIEFVDHFGRYDSSWWLHV